MSLKINHGRRVGAVTGRCWRVRRHRLSIVGSAVAVVEIISCLLPCRATRRTRARLSGICCLLVRPSWPSGAPEGHRVTFTQMPSPPVADCSVRRNDVRTRATDHEPHRAATGRTYNGPTAPFHVPDEHIAVRRNHQRSSLLTRPVGGHRPAWALNESKLDLVCRRPQVFAR